jgi:hypothetical protein
MILLNPKKTWKPFLASFLLCAFLHGTPASSRQDIKDIPDSTSISAITGDKTLTSGKGQEILVYSFSPSSSWHLLKRRGISRILSLAGRSSASL